jgi:hypothetical protein
MTLLPNVDVICDRQQLAGVLGVSDRQIDRLVVDHVLKPVRCKLRGKHFRLAAAVQSYLAHRERYVTERSAGSNGEYDVARTRRMVALAKREEIETAAREGLYLRKTAVEFHIGMLLRNCRDRILAIPSRLGHVLIGKANFREVYEPLDSEVRLALTEVSERKVFDWPRMVKETRAYLMAEGFDAATADEMVDEVMSQYQRRDVEQPPE